ncbi:membrane protein [[Clostridium] sordellii]|uniref:FUSC family protein n=1 Tax=Paraclostridium sordellii TaxID=1505 RepID=UPI0005E2048A|nr:MULTISPECIES: aromatic acid exporter family protein [Paeniclostridium]MBW4861224.1 FUSC family protein [Paeniclostridium sp.]MBW4873538.1 FUSC family protein [Paeniclostridium sp.]MDU1453637.1 aromatic acid exporter family protein [Paeniclostridium sordellii]CEN92754.1 membrane protein [[Clostridium] sordellii] [Paeniclostridium sordellii]CEN96413.1 membrane protein [[Clostridium] sordellii] [Paeniclostridium sordellii]
MKLKKMGMRTIKTGIAVMICLLLGKFLVQKLFYCAIACVISVQDTVKGSMKVGLNRVKGTIVGGIIGFLFALIQPGEPVLCGIGIMLTIYTCNMLKISSVVVSCVTFLAIHLGVGTYNPAYYSIHRVIDTSVGVIIGVVTNYLIARPNYLAKTVSEFKNIEKSAIQLIESKIVNEEDLDINVFKKNIQQLDKIYSKLTDELDYGGKNDADIENLEKSISICREIYFHMQSIELLESKLYLNKDNYNALRELYNTEEISFDVEENKSPVFNYHLSKIIEEIKTLKEFNKSIE